MGLGFRIYRKMERRKISDFPELSIPALDLVVAWGGSRGGAESGGVGRSGGAHVEILKAASFAKEPEIVTCDLRKVFTDRLSFLERSW